ncbi:hypothetical protein NL676_024382 [Syzygium grande]|nr:hypothetical protein NL676_024382 [Syzygium grande]
MPEASATTLLDPPHPLETDPTPVMETHQTVLGAGVNKTAGHISGIPPSVLHEAERPLGLRPILKGSSSGSREQQAAQDRASHVENPHSLEARPETSSRPRGTGGWTQVNRKKGKSHLIPPSSSPARPEEANAGEKTRASSTSSGQPLIRNTLGGTLQDLAPGSSQALNRPPTSSAGTDQTSLSPARSAEDVIRTTPAHALDASTGDFSTACFWPFLCNSSGPDQTFRERDRAAAFKPLEVNTGGFSSRPEPSSELLLRAGQNGPVF